jgi:hypothetical protein
MTPLDFEEDIIEVKKGNNKLMLIDRKKKSNTVLCVPQERRST